MVRMAFNSWGGGILEASKEAKGSSTSSEAERGFALLSEEG